MKNLTLRYSITQFTYWAASSGASALAAAYLMEKGIPTGIVGAMLAGAKLSACAAQPYLAAAVDRMQRFVLKRLLLLLSVSSCFCLAVQLAPDLPAFVSGGIYAAGLFCASLMAPMLSALSIACSRAGYPVNYSAARGVGSAATAFAALAAGAILAGPGEAWLMLFLLAMRLISIASLADYPEIQKIAPPEAAQRCTIGAFFRSYRGYCASLAGIALLAMFHAMTENYMIAIVGRFGGDSGHAGMAVFIAAISGAPVIFMYGKLRRRAGDILLLRFAAVSFLLKAILLCFVRSITGVYLLQLLQMTSYALLEPAQVYYAQACMRGQDMVKGQAFISAAYALGCSAGSFAGGQLLNAGVGEMLAAGVLMALTGTIILFMTAGKQAEGGWD